MIIENKSFLKENIYILKKLFLQNKLFLYWEMFCFQDGHQKKFMRIFLCDH